MSKDHPNFYENIKEANLRLQYTVVLYDDIPYHILCITDDRPDGIFRVYMEPIGHPNGSVFDRIGSVPHDYPDHSQRGKLMDQWMVNFPDSGVIRKMMNSPSFNRFRPFPLGMCNYGGHTVYMERQPQRHTQQGLTQNMIQQERLMLSDTKGRGGMVGIMSPSFKDCVMHFYPSIEESIKNLSDPDIQNESVAFHKDFALLRGPVGSLFMAYKTDIIGILPNSDLSCVAIASKFSHTKEVVAELGVFKDIVIKK